jgi:hypothetical protein
LPKRTVRRNGGERQEHNRLGPKQRRSNIL